MPIDPNLIGNAMANWQRPPVYDPLAQYAKIQALKNGIGQQQLQQQALQEGALDLQEKQDQISGQKALADAIRANVTPGADGTPTINHQAVVQALGASGHGELINGYMNGVAKQDADKAATTKVQLENRLSSLDLATRAFDAATDQNGWDHALAAAHGLGVDTGALGIPAAFSPEAKTAVINFGLTAKDKLAADAAALTAKTKQDTEARNAQKERDQRFINAVGAAQSQQALDALRQPALASDSGISPAVVGAVPPMFSPTAIAAYKRSQITPEQSIQADQAALNEQNAEKDRLAAQKQRDEQIGIARARLGVEQQRLKNEATVAGPFVGLPPQERAKAETAYDKDTKDYTDKISAARGFQDLVAQAQGGNKAAPALVPIQELRSYLNRINATELQSVGVNAGSLKDQVEGYIDGKFKGQPIPPALLNDMLDVSKSQEKAAQRGYLGRLAANKAAFGASPPPIDIESVYGGGTAPAQSAQVPAAVQSALKNAGPGIHTLSDKSRWMVGADGTITPQ